jgi:phosphoglycerate dehydrogenase-like enzyme
MESDFVAVCCQWTPETTGLIGREALAAMKQNAVLVNVARGEIIDENALVAALDGGKLRGVALDVYLGEFEGPPDVRLWDNERVIITPHVSAATDISRHRGMELFFRNLDAYLNGQPLANVIDWSTGY